MYYFFPSRQEPKSQEAACGASDAVCGHGHQDRGGFLDVEGPRRHRPRAHSSADRWPVGYFHPTVLSTDQVCVDQALPTPTPLCQIGE